jgi:hypothetical protein
VPRTVVFGGQQRSKTSHKRKSGDTFVISYNNEIGWHASWGEHSVHDESSQGIDYPEIRRVKGDANSQSLMDQGGRFRRKLRITFDTQVFQYCANERSENQGSIVKDGPWAGLHQTFRKTIPGGKPSGQGDDPNEHGYIYALCELCRRADAEILILPSISQERQHPRHGHYHGLERLDFDVPFTPYPILCSKMRSASSRIMTSEEKSEGCLRDVAHYGPLLQHLIGKGQRKDVAAYIEADMADTDVFVSLDGKFINPFRQIENKLREAGVRTLVMRPSEFCKEAKLQPIPFPPPNPRQSMGSSPPER